MKIVILTCIALQTFGFLPIYFMYRKDCKVYGKEELAVPLKERFMSWLIFFPFWLIPLLV